MSEPYGACMCTDKGCNTSHKGVPRCIRKARETLYRVDMDDQTGVDFCDECAEDALGSGVFD